MVDLCRDVELQRKPALPVTVSYSEGVVRGSSFWGAPQGRFTDRRESGGYGPVARRFVTYPFDGSPDTNSCGRCQCLRTRLATDVTINPGGVSPIARISLPPSRMTNLSTITKLGLLGSGWKEVVPVQSALTS